MFCSNCGNRVPDGSNFCSACGARIAVAVDTPAVKPVELHKPTERKQDFSFDWSSVKDEPQRKPVREVASPWGSTGLNTETVEEGAPRSRTLSFIDILKKEREEKARAAEAETVAEFAVEQPEPQNAAPGRMHTFYQPPMYDDLNSHTVTPYDNMQDEPVQEEPVYEAPKFETIDKFDPVMEELNISVESEEPTIILDGSEFVNGAHYEESSKAKLDAELAAILDVGSGNPAGEEDDSVDLFEDTEEIDFPVKTMEQDEIVLRYDPEDDGEPEESFDYEALIAELNDIAGTDPTEVRLSDYIDEPEEYTEELETEEEPAPALEEYEEDVEDDYIPTHSAAEVEPIEDEPVEEEPLVDESIVQEKDAEIDALKRRLAELMGEAVEAPVIEPVIEAEPEITVEELVVEAEPEVVEEPEVIEEPDVVAAPVVEEIPEAVEVTAEPEPETEEFAEPVKRGPIVEHYNWFSNEVESAPEVEAEVIPEEIETIEEVAEPEIVAEPEVEEELPLIDPTPEAEEVLPLINEEHEEAVIAEEKEEAVEDDSTDAMSVEELEKDLFGEVAGDDAEAEATKKIDKFYTLYKKNEEFQRLLDEEYNKLKHEDDEVVPTVSAILDGVENAATEEAAEVVETVKEEVAAVAPVVEKAEEVAQEAVSAVETVSKEDAVADKEASGKGGTALTVIAVFVAILLVILLAVILVLNFAPDSAIALKLDSIIEMITSYFSAVDVPGNFLL